MKEVGRWREEGGMEERKRGWYFTATGEIGESMMPFVFQHISTGSAGYWSFQLFGLDFMLDEHFQVWLLEINGAPACARYVNCATLCVCVCVCL